MITFDAFLLWEKNLSRERLKHERFGQAFMNDFDAIPRDDCALWEADEKTAKAIIFNNYLIFEGGE